MSWQLLLQDSSYLQLCFIFAMCRMLCCAVAGDDEGELRLADLMAAAASGPASAAASSIRSARKLLERMEKQSAPLSVPLPRTVAERVERQAGYEDTKQDVTKWQPIVKVGSWVAAGVDGRGLESGAEKGAGASPAGMWGG
jgi:hypothetical protein